MTKPLTVTPGSIGVTSVDGTVVLFFGTKLITTALTPEEADALALTIKGRADDARLFNAIKEQRAKKGAGT